MARRSPIPLSVPKVFERLYDHYGPQHWWPADSPFEVMVGAILTQNTAWANVEKAIANLQQARRLSPEALVAATPGEVAELLRPAGYFNVKERRLRNFCVWYLEQGGYRALAGVATPALRQGLLSVNGIGYETADDILLYAFQRPVFVVDAYTGRLFHRLGLVEADPGYESLREWLEAALPVGSRSRALGTAAGLGRVDLFNEYHALIVTHAKDACRARGPLCRRCCLVSGCPSAAQAAGRGHSGPVRRAQRKSTDKQ